MTKQNSNQVQPLVAAYANRTKKEQARIKKANTPEIAWETVYNLLSNDKAKLLKSELKAMGIKSGKEPIVTIHSNEEWSNYTEDGRHPYILIGGNNFVLCGTVNDKPKRVFKSSGKIPPNTKIFADLANDEHIYVAFPESKVKKYTVKECL